MFAPAGGQIEFLRGIAVFCGVLLIGVAGATPNVGLVRSRVRTILLVSLGALVAPLAATLALAPLADTRLRGPEASAWSFAVFAGLALSVSAVPVIVKIFADLKVLHRNLSQLSLSVAVIDDATVWIGLSAIAAVIHLPAGGRVVRRSPATSGWFWPPLPVLGGPPGGRPSVYAGAQQRPTGRKPSGAGAWCLTAAAFITLGAVITEGIGLDFDLGSLRLRDHRRLRPAGAGGHAAAAAHGGAGGPRSAVLGGQRTVGRSAGPGRPDTGDHGGDRGRSAVVTKTFGAYGGGRLAGMDHPSAMAVGSALNARGTVQLVIAAAGLRLGLITTEGFTILVLVALVTSAMAGPLIQRFLTRVPETPEEIERARLID